MVIYTGVCSFAVVFSSQMEENSQLCDEVSEAVLKHLAVTQGLAQHIAQHILSLGIKDITQLRLVKETDLVPDYLSCMDARTLLEAWTTQYSKFRESKNAVIQNKMMHLKYYLTSLDSQSALTNKKFKGPI